MFPFFKFCLQGVPGSRVVCCRRFCHLLHGAGEKHPLSSPAGKKSFSFYTPNNKQWKCHSYIWAKNYANPFPLISKDCQLVKDSLHVNFLKTFCGGERSKENKKYTQFSNQVILFWDYQNMDTVSYFANFCMIFDPFLIFCGALSEFHILSGC